MNKVSGGLSGLMRGRFFSEEELVLVRKIVADTYHLGRTKASTEICIALDWRQPNGWLKDRACRDVLRMLELRGYLSLPPQKSNPTGNKMRRLRANDNELGTVDTSDLTDMDFAAITLQQVKGTNEEAVWNALIAKFHYRGFSVLVGRSLKYLIKIGDRIIGAWGASDCAWSLDARDRIFRAAGFGLPEVRSRVVNNSRFLILPWVKVPNLASHLLAIAAYRVKHDWELYYSIVPLALETFVESGLFLGTSYKAANWICVGNTKGYKKVGQLHSNSQSPKAIFIFPFGGQLRRKIQKHA